MSKRHRSPPPLFESKKKAKTPMGTTSTHRNSGKDPIWFNFHDEVMKMGATQLHGINKRDYIKKKFEAEGRKPMKNQKAPFKMLIGMREKQKERDIRRRETLKESGMLRDFQKKLGKRESTSKTDFIKRVTHGDREGLLSGSRALKISSGTFANGTLHLPASHIASVQRQHLQKKNANAQSHRGGGRGRGGRAGRGGRGKKH